MQELPGYFVTAEDIARCVGVSVPATAKICTTLSRRGVLESRTVTWRAERSRTRSHMEFCYPARSTTWRRYPAWLEPPLFPAPPCARIVRGRAAIKEYQPMNEQEYKALERPVRERFSAIQDDHFDDRSDVIAARQRLEAAETAHREACEAAHQVRNRKVQIDSLVKSLDIQRREFHNSRLQHVADALATKGRHDVSLKADRHLAEQIEQADLLIAAAPLAQSDLDAQLVALNRRVQLAAGDVTSATEDLRELIDHLKLDLAKRS